MRDHKEGSVLTVSLIDALLVLLLMSLVNQAVRPFRVKSAQLAVEDLLDMSMSNRQCSVKFNGMARACRWHRVHAGGSTWRGSGVGVSFFV